MRQDKPLEVCFINSKGFGGNNASGVVLSPRIAEKMLRKRHGQAAFAAYVEKREQTAPPPAPTTSARCRATWRSSTTSART